MKKPLLTDEMIAEAQKEANWDKRVSVKANPDNRSVYKSRRIENAKRGAFQHKLNTILVVVVLLILALVYAIFRL